MTIFNKIYISTPQFFLHTFDSILIFIEYFKYFFILYSIYIGIQIFIHVILEKKSKIFFLKMYEIIETLVKTQNRSFLKELFNIFNICFNRKHKTPETESRNHQEKTLEDLYLFAKKPIVLDKEYIFPLMTPPPGGDDDDEDSKKKEERKKKNEEHEKDRRALEYAEKRALVLIQQHLETLGINLTPKQLKYVHHLAVRHMEKRLYRLNLEDFKRILRQANISYEPQAGLSDFQTYLVYAAITVLIVSGAYWFINWYFKKPKINDLEPSNSSQTKSNDDSPQKQSDSRSQTKTNLKTKSPFDKLKK